MAEKEITFNQREKLKEKLRETLEKLKTAGSICDELKKTQEHQIDNLKKLNDMFDTTLKLLDELKKAFSDELKKAYELKKTYEQKNKLKR